MKNFLMAGWALLLSVFGCRIEPHAPLFPYWENNKFGYIDNQGKVIIPARFNAVEEFSEGVASVREGGYYGYINPKGEWVIQPVYDYAQPFSEGIAVVYKGAKANYIRRDGTVILEIDCAEAGAFLDGNAMIESRNKKYGVIDTSGHFIIDTLYTDITPVKGGSFIISPSYDSAYIVNRKGAVIVPVGKYRGIKEIGEGYLQAAVLDTVHHKEISALLDPAGRELFRKGDSQTYFNMEMSSGKLTFEEYISGHKAIYGIMDKAGNVIYADSTFESILPFRGNRSFIRRRYAHYVITGDGKILTAGFDRLLNDGFVNNRAFVETNSKWGVIDTNANYIIQPKFNEIMKPGLVGGVFFFKGLPTRTGKSTFGFADSSGKVILQPCLENYDVAGFRNGLLRCVLDNSIAYIDRTGKVVWQEKADMGLRLLDIDYMQRAYGYVAQEMGETAVYKTYNEGWSLPRKISAGTNMPAGSLCLQVQTSSRDTFENRYSGYSVSIYNNTDTSILFDTQDNGLYLKMQACINSEWKDIEYIPSSWCGNSYYKVELGSKKYWQLQCPVYIGSIKAKLRMSLAYKLGRDDDDIVIYSNVFEGSINPGQLWRKEGHQAVNIMDPYMD
ncbi:WG repeat-containing protein [Chitinophaga agrisoli]|uniref:WG repeat-containing protein n=1 Tax=Chitinophaga agrisoli TaxID=2607653 RepID=A0A5B2VZ56_9BACT|nr:WG repeat-containing protein [Chitinophaga agrisoli]KAA2243526.1 WG repeat-containing protein [Chitinophaga agrisoli]